MPLRENANTGGVRSSHRKVEVFISSPLSGRNLTIGEAVNAKAYEKKESVENAVAKIREKYGYATMQRGVVLLDENVNGLDIRGKKDD